MVLTQPASLDFQMVFMFCSICEDINTRLDKLCDILLMTTNGYQTEP